jgi:hypothetical protein
MGHARQVIQVSPDTLAKLLAVRAQGYKIKDACAAAGVSDTTLYRLRSQLGIERFNEVLDELRRLYATGASETTVRDRARRFLLGRKTEREVAEQAETGLAWGELERRFRELFRRQAENSRGRKRARFEHVASAAFWKQVRIRAGAIAGVHPDELDSITGSAAVLRTAWLALRGINPQET